MEPLFEKVSTSSSEDRKVRVSRTLHSRVIITLDETIGSKLLYHKFKYQTIELQLFLQHVPVLCWYPLQVIGTSNFKYNIDPCVFRAAVRNPLHKYSTKQLIKSMMNEPYENWNGSKVESEMKVIESIQNFLMKENQDIKQSKLNLLLESLLNDKLFIEQTKTESDLQSVQSKINDHYLQIYNAWTSGNYISQHYEKMKDDEETVFELVRLFSDFSCSVFKYASDRLKDNEPFVLKVVKHNGCALKYASQRLKDNEELVFEAIKTSTLGVAFFCASNRLKDDEEFVLKAVKENGYAIRHASERLQHDEKIVLEAVKKNGNALVHLPDRFQDDEVILLEAAKQHGCALMFASQRLRDNEQIILQTIKTNAMVLFCTSDRLKDNEQFILQVVKLNGKALKYASDRLKDNEEIVMEAIKQNVCALQFASERLRNFDFFNQIFKICNTLDVFQYFGMELRNIEFIYYFIENYQSIFHELVRKNN